MLHPFRHAHILQMVQVSSSLAKASPIIADRPPQRSVANFKQVVSGRRQLEGAHKGTNAEVEVS